MRRAFIFILVTILFLFSFGCSSSTRDVDNAPKLIEVFIEGISEMSLNRKFSPIIFNVLSEIESVDIGQSPTIVIVCENIEKDTFLDVEIYDSYFSDRLISYSGNSDEYSARVTTTKNLETEIWTTTIKIKIPSFESFEDRTIEVRKINFLREWLSTPVEAIIDETSINSLQFHVNPELPYNFLKESLFQEFMLRYQIWYVDEFYSDGVNVIESNDIFTLTILEFNTTISYGEQIIADLPTYNSDFLIIPLDYAGKKIDLLRLYVNNEKINFIFTSLDYKIIELLGNDNFDYTIYCAFDSQDIFKGKTAEAIFSEININGYQIVYNFLLN